MFAGRTAAKVPAGHQDFGPLEAWIIKWMLAPRLLPIVFKGMFAQTIKCNAPQIPGGNDAIGVDVVEQQRQAAASHLLNLLRHKVSVRGSEDRRALGGTAPERPVLIRGEQGSLESVAIGSTEQKSAASRPSAAQMIAISFGNIGSRTSPW